MYRAFKAKGKGCRNRGMKKMLRRGWQQCLGEELTHRMGAQLEKEAAPTVQETSRCPTHKPSLGTWVGTVHPPPLSNARVSGSEGAEAKVTVQEKPVYRRTL